MSERRAPVQECQWYPGMSPEVPHDLRGRIPAGTVPWSVHLQAWAGYDAAGHGDQSAERIAQRDGFSYGEIQCALAGHYNECGRCREPHPPIPGWEPRRRQQ